MPSTGIIDRLRSDVPTPTGSSRRAIYSKDKADGERRTRWEYAPISAQEQK